MFEEIILSGAGELGVPLEGGTPAVLRRFYDFLEEKNRVMDLTAIEGEDEAARAHFLDSLALSPLIPQGARLADVGSGAGFPGVPLAIARRDISAVLMDSMGKRCDFLKEAARLQGMPRYSVCLIRAEDAGLAPEHREGYDAVTARAVAKLYVLAELCLPLVKPGGVFLAMKGPGAAEELKEAQKAIAAMGGGNARIADYHIPGSDRTRCAVVIEKLSPTPKAYPRKYAKIVKYPLI